MTSHGVRQQLEETRRHEHPLQCNEKARSGAIRIDPETCEPYSPKQNVQSGPLNCGEARELGTDPVKGEPARREAVSTNHVADRGATERGPSVPQRERKRCREKPTHRRNPGYDIRSRANRGRSRRRGRGGEPEQRQVGDRAVREEVQILTWNVGGLPKDRMEEMVALLPALGLGQVEVLALQEVSCPEGWTELTHGKGIDGWRIVAGKRSKEWRGSMTAVRKSLGKITHKELGEDAPGDNEG